MKSGFSVEKVLPSGLGFIVESPRAELGLVPTAGTYLSPRKKIQSSRTNLIKLITSTASRKIFSSFLLSRR